MIDVSVWFRLMQVRSMSWGGQGASGRGSTGKGRKQRVRCKGGAARGRGYRTLYELRMEPGGAQVVIEVWLNFEGSK